MRSASASAKEWAIAALFVFCSGLAFRCTILASGVPSFRHDWSWTDLREAQIAPMRFLLSVWNPNGLGSPNVRVVNHPALWLQHWLGFVLDPKALLVLVLIASTTAFAWGTFRLIRLFGVPIPVAIAAAIAAAFGPATFTKFVAGHWYYLVAAAAIPWAIASACEVRTPSLLAGALRTGAIVALTSLQPQLWVFCEIAVLGVILSGAERKRSAVEGRLLAGALVAVTGALLIVPSIAGTLGAHSAGLLAGQQTIPDWERNNSAPLAAAPIALGYFTHYAETAYAAAGTLRFAAWLLWLVPLGALFGLVEARRPALAVIALLWIVAMLLVAGLYGPAAAPLSWIYSRFLWASAFRELYHFALPMWLCACVLAAVGIAPWKAWPAAIVALAWVFAAAALWFAPNYGGLLFSFAPSPDVRAAQQTLARTAGDYRYALLPAIAPLGARTRDGLNGLDPNATPIGDHPIANTQSTSGALAAMLLLAQRHDADARAWLDAGGVGATIEQSEIASRPYEAAPVAEALQRRLEDLEPARTPPSFAFHTWPTSVAFAATTIDVVDDPFTQTFRDGFLLARDVGASGWQSFSAPPIDSTRLDVFNGWAPARFWYWLDPQVAFWPQAAVTLSHQPLMVPNAYRNGWALVFSTAGRIAVDRRTLALPMRRVTWVALDGAREVSADGGLSMVVGFSLARPQTKPNATPGRRWDIPFSYDCLCATGELSNDARWFVLKQSYDDGWSLAVRGGRVLRHVLYSGYGNAWEIAVESKPASYALSYTPARWWQPLVYASIVAWLLVVVAALALRGRRGVA